MAQHFIFFSIVSELIDGIVQETSVSALFISLLSEIFSMVCFWVVMQHQAYVLIEVNDEDVNVRMGPCAWPLLGWFCSSQILKSEVVSIERKERACCYDIVPRLYCDPVNWCCCHKSYSAYYWPFCCNDTSWCGLCEGDSDSSVMVQFNLTQSETDFSPMCCKRCAPCPCPIAILWYVFYVFVSFPLLLVFVSFCFLLFFVFCFFFLCF